MKTAWIVEYGYDGCGEHSVFSAVFGTKRSARRYAMKCADEHRIDYLSCDYGSAVISEAIVHGDNEVHLNNENGVCMEWWTYRKVPFTK